LSNEEQKENISKENENKITQLKNENDEHKDYISKLEKHKEESE
jgi:hypothetical protein